MEALNEPNSGLVAIGRQPAEYGCNLCSACQTLWTVYQESGVPMPILRRRRFGGEGGYQSGGSVT